MKQRSRWKVIQAKQFMSQYGAGISEYFQISRSRNVIGLARYRKGLSDGLLV
jgi:hypothetical protein